MPTRDRRDTPAQDRAAGNREFGRDFSALQQAGMWSNDRTNDRNAVSGAVRGSSAPLPQRSNTGSPTPGRIAGDVAGGARAGAGAASDWRTSTLAADQSGPQSSRGGVTNPALRQGGGAVAAARDGGAPNLGPAISDREIARQQQQGGAIGGAFGSVLGSVTGRGTGAGSGFDQSQLQGTQGWGQGALNIRAPGQVARDMRSGTPTTPAQPGRPSTPAQPQPQGRSAREVLAGVNQSAMGSARDAGRAAEESTQGYFVGPDGQRVNVPGTRRVQDGIGGARGPSVIGDMGAANEEFARANAIRQETIDRQRPQNQVTIIPDSGAQERGPDAQIERLVSRAGSERDPWKRAALNRQISQLQSVAGRQADSQQASDRNQVSLDTAQMQQQGAMDRTQFEAAQRAASSGQLSGTDIYNLARAEREQFDLQRARGGIPDQRPGLDMDTVEAYRAIGDEEGATEYVRQVEREGAKYDLYTTLDRLDIDLEEALELWEQGATTGTVLEGPMRSLYGDRGEQSFAEGGYVQPPMGMEQSMGPTAGPMDMGAGGMATGAGMQPPMMAEYEQYAQGSQQLGIDPIPYEEFVSMQPQPAPAAPAGPAPTEQFGAMGFAMGGEIPDMEGGPAHMAGMGAMGSMGGMGQEEMLAGQIGATMGGEDPYDASGQLLMDTDPNAPTDSIPALIDGQHPAKLDSGEFVIPEHVVRFHGLDKLHKLIAQADKEASNGADRPSTGNTPQTAQSLTAR